MTMQVVSESCYANFNAILFSYADEETKASNAAYNIIYVLIFEDNKLALRANASLNFKFGIKKIEIIHGGKLVINSGSKLHCDYPIENNIDLCKNN